MAVAEAASAEAAAAEAAAAEAAAAVEIAKRKRHFERSSVYLIINTALSGGLGTLFWLLAARIYPEDQVGPAVAAASLLLALAFAAQLNLPTALSRFLPSAGDAKRSMVWFCYRISVGGGVLCGVVLIAATYLLGGQLFAGGRMPLIAVLAISVPVWTIFAMQDSVMIAARSSGVVPIENAVSTIAKFAVLPIGIALGLGDGSGILLAWTVPTLIAIPAVNYIIFTRILKRPKVPTRMPSRRKFVSYALRDFPGAILYLFSLRLIPLIIVSGGNRLDGAYIGLPWTILTVAALALPTLSRSLLAELSHEDSDTASLLRRANRLVLRLVLPAAVAAALLAHPVMSVAGGHYASRGAPVLAWGILGLVPAALVESQLATLRFQGAVTTCSIIQAARAIGLVGGVVVLLQVGNASGIGIVLLVVNAAAAVVGWLTTRNPDVRWTVAMAHGESSPATMRDPEVAKGHPATPAQEILASAATPGGAAVDAGAEPPARPAHRNPRGVLLRPLLRMSPLVIGAILGFIGAVGTNPAKITGLGLISAVPPVYVVGTALVIWGALLNLGPDRARRLALFAHLAVLIVLLDGLPGIAEPNPRFSTAWLHAGFIQFLATGHGLLLRVDARFSWAGFFSAGALIQRAAGTPSTLWLVRFTPLAFAAFACWAIWLIGRTLRFSVVQRQIAMVIFVAGNWSGQDYFSPQATAFSLFFALCAVALTVFSGPGLREGRRLDRWLRPDRPPAIDPLSPAQSTATYVGFLVLLVAIMMTHQLTPGFIALTFALLAITKTTRLRSLPLIAGLLTVAWLSFAAEAYWTGHLSKLTAGAGSLGNLVHANIGKRATGGTFDRAVVVASRIGMAGVIWAAAGFAAIVLWRRRRTPIAALCLFGAGFPLLILQPYGGEMLIRVFVFSLPAVSLLIATLIAPTYLSPRRLSKGLSKLALRFRRRRVVAGLVMAVAVPGFLLARFGNESYEQVSTNDRATVNAMYRTAPTDSIIYIEDRQALLSSQRVGDVRFQNLNSIDPHQVEAQIRSSTGRQVATYILLTESEQAYAEQVTGLPPNWAEGLVRALLADGGYDVEFRAGRSVLVRAVVPISSPASPRGIRAR